MSQVVNKINVDIVVGSEQKDPRWAEWSSLYSESPDLFAFWDIVSTTQPGKDDMRSLTQKQTPGGQAGFRPGNTPSQNIAPFTSQAGSAQPTYVTMDPDQVAKIKVIRNIKQTDLRSIVGVKVIGDQRITVPAQPQKVAPPLVNSSGVEVLFESDSFLLQSAQESFQEKFEIKETFGEPIVFMFGERQKIFQYGGTLLDTQSWQWKEKFIDCYNRFLRGSKAIENNAIVILVTNSAIIRGYVLHCGTTQNDQTHGYVGFNFAMFVQDRIPINKIEPSPQDRALAGKEDGVQSNFFTINDKVSSPDGTVKTFDLTNATVELPSGFQADDFSQTTPPIATHLKAVSSINGKDPAAIPITLSPPQATYDPPDIRFPEMPSEYQGEIFKATLGRLGQVGRPELQAGSPLVVGDFSMGAYEIASLGASASIISVQNVTLLFNTSIAGASTYIKDSIDKLKAIADAGNLVVVVREKSSPNIDTATRNVKSMRLIRPDPTNDVAEGQYFSQLINSAGENTGIPFGNTPPDLAFEMELDSSIPPSVFGLPSFGQNNFFRIQFFEKNVFLLPGTTVTRYFHAIDAQDVRSVGDANGGSRAVADEGHVLTDADGQFMTTVKPLLDAGNNVFATLPYEVIDQNASDLTPNAQVKVYSVISDTQLQLGKLVKTPIPAEQNQLIGKMEIPSYQVIIKRNTGISLNQAAIQTSVQNPPDGAFDNLDLSVANIVQPRGAFALKIGVHYTKQP